VRLELKVATGRFQTPGRSAYADSRAHSPRSVLVLIDGRSVYTPLCSQAVLLASPGQHCLRISTGSKSSEARRYHLGSECRQRGNQYHHQKSSGNPTERLVSHTGGGKCRSRLFSISQYGAGNSKGFNYRHITGRVSPEALSFIIPITPTIR